MKAQARIRAGLLAVAGMTLLWGQTTHATAADARNKSTSVTGTLLVTWGDPPRYADDPVPRLRYALLDDQGRQWTLQVTDEALWAAGGIAALHRSTVVVTGTTIPDHPMTLAVATIQPDEQAAPLDPARGPLGPQAYVWILLRFADNPATPEQPSWFWTQALGSYPSLDDYWRELSFECINLTGSNVVGWYDLPHPRSHYVYDIDPDDPGDELDGIAALNDAVALADPVVYFPSYIGINLIFNDTLDCCAWGGTASVTADGQTKIYGVTWMPPWGWRELGVIGHEMGHALGLPHSSGPYGAVYDSDWDVMSGSYGTCTVDDPTYGCLGVHTISYHKDMLDWIHPLHKYEMTTTPTVASVWLNDLVVVPPSGRLLMARIPLNTDPSQFYTFEQRHWTGYDQNIPGESVIMHSVDPSRSNPAWVVDCDGDGDCNDDGAQWELGESFVDQTNTVVMTVEWTDEWSSILTLTNAARNVVYVDWGNNGFENGSPTYPWNTVWEGHGAVFPEGTVYINPGSYPETLTLRKPATLRRWGSSGLVRIGP